VGLESFDSECFGADLIDVRGRCDRYPGQGLGNLYIRRKPRLWI
jgi:hypothetical protein